MSGTSGRGRDRGHGDSVPDPEDLAIPTLPETVLRLDELLADPDGDLEAAARIVASDPPIAAGVLRYANCAVYGPRSVVTDLHHATTVLGTRVLRNLVLQAAVIQHFDHLRGAAALHVDDLWRHSVATAILCERLMTPGTPLAESLAPLDENDLYACGLLHDLGRVVLLDALPELYGDVLRLSRERNLPSHLLEDHVLGYSHPRIGAIVARRWNLPRIVADAIEHHHDPWDRLASSRHVLTVVAADHLAKLGLDAEEPPPELRETRTWKFLQIDPSSVPDLMEFARGLSAQVPV